MLPTICHSFMSIVRAAENGIQRDDLVQQIGEEAPTLNQASRNNVVAQAVAIGLLSVESGTYRPTTAGRGLLEGEPAANMLYPAFVRTVFGFALLLDDVRLKPGIERGQLAEKAQAYYPRWTTEFAPNALVAWLRELGLAGVEGAGRPARVTLTKSGEYWASGLPSNLDARAPALPVKYPPRSWLRMIRRHCPSDLNSPRRQLMTLSRVFGPSGAQQLCVLDGPVAHGPCGAARVARKTVHLARGRIRNRKKLDGPGVREGLLRSSRSADRASLLAGRRLARLDRPFGPPWFYQPARPAADIS